MAKRRQKRGAPSPPDDPEGVSRRDFLKAQTTLGLSLLMAGTLSADTGAGDGRDLGDAAGGPVSVRPDLGIVIVGASSGMGAELARQYAEHGANLVLAARRTDRLDQVAAEVSGRGGVAHVVTTDVRRESDCAALIAEAISWLGARGKGIDVLVLGSLRGHAAVFGPEAATAVWQNVVQTSYFGPALCLKHALPHLKARASTVFYFNSVGSTLAVPVWGAYSQVKHAWHALMNTLKFENPELTVVSTRFSSVDTEAFDKELTVFDDDKRYCPSFSRTYGGLTPGRLWPEEVAVRKAIAAIESGTENAFLSGLNEASWLVAFVRQDLGWFVLWVELILGHEQVQQIEARIAQKLAAPGAPGYVARLLRKLEKRDPGSELVQAAALLLSVERRVSIYLLAHDEMIDPAVLGEVRTFVEAGRRSLADGSTKQLLLGLSSGSFSPPGIAADQDGLAPVVACPPAGIPL